MPSMEKIESNSRNKSQEMALQLMYSFLIDQDLNIPIDFEKAVSEMEKKPYEECDIFLKEILIKSLQHENDIVGYCEEFLTKWKFKRLNYCSQAILILSIANYEYIRDSDKAVIINVAIKLAKKYCEENDYKYINAVLDKCLND